MTIDEDLEQEPQRSSQPANFCDRVEFQEGPVNVELRVGQDSERDVSAANDGKSFGTEGQEAKNQVSRPSTESQAKPAPVSDVRHTVTASSVEQGPAAGIAGGSKLPRAITGVAIFVMLVLLFALAVYCEAVNVDRRLILLLLVGGTFIFSAANYIWFYSALIKVNKYIQTRVPGASLEPPSSLVCVSVVPTAFVICAYLLLASFGNVLFLNLPFFDALVFFTMLAVLYWGFVQFRWIWRLGWFFRNVELEKQHRKVSKRRSELSLRERTDSFLERWKVLLVSIGFCLAFPLSWITSAVYVNFLNNSIRAVFEDDFKEKAFKRELPKDIPKDRFLIRYRAYAAIELWFRQRFRSRKKLGLARGMLAFLSAPFLVIGGCLAVGWLVQTFLPTLPSVFATIPISPTSGKSNITTMVVMACLAVAALGLAMWRVGGKPSHYEFSPVGLRPVRKSWGKLKAGPFFEWASIAQVSLESGARAGDSAIVFHLKDARKEKLKLSSIDSTDDREAILKAIELWAPSLPRTSEVVQALQPPMDHSYTELWLQALAAPPERDRLKPLTAGVSLKEQRYKINKSLGVGGQGSAYEAVDQLTEDVVVLKEFLLPVYVDVSVRKEVLESFENEAKLLRQLDHRQVVKLVDFFVEDHRAYLVLEHIDGLSLRALVDKHGRLPESRVNELARSMCEILEYLHGREPPVVHRDFTPDNLILRSDGLLKLIDFNVAQQLESGATGSVVGKPAYLPPEQFRGLPVTQSDLYALGATMMFLLTGRDPEPISVSHPRELDASLSERIDSVVARATAEEIGKRYSLASQLLSDLEPAHSLGADLNSVIGECREKVTLKADEDETSEALESVTASSAGVAPDAMAHSSVSDAPLQSDEPEQKPAATMLNHSKPASTWKRPFAMAERLLQGVCCLALLIGIMIIAVPTSLLMFDPDRDYNSRLVAAANHFKNREFELARKECDQAIAIHPERPKAYWLRGRSTVQNAEDLEDQAKVDAARSDFKKMLTLPLDDADVYSSISQLVLLKDYQGAVDLSQKKVKELWYMNLFYMDNELKLLKDVYVQAAYLHLGKPELALKLLEGIFEKSHADFEKSHAEWKFNPSTYGLRAVLNELCHNCNNAKRWLAKSKDSRHRYYGKLTPLDLHREAMAHAQEFPQDEKSESALWSFSEGVGLYGICLYDKAKRAFDDLITLKPEFVDGYLWRGDANLRLSDFKMALADADKSIALSPNSVRAHYIRGRALLGLERYDEAAKEIAITMSGGESDTPSVRYVRGRILLAQGKAKEAIEDFKYAFQNGQDMALTSRAAIGEINALVKLGQFETALLNCRQVTSRGKLGEVSYLEGTIYDAMGKTKEARESFSKAQSLGFNKDTEFKGRTLFIRLDNRIYLSPQSWFLTDI